MFLYYLYTHAHDVTDMRYKRNSIDYCNLHTACMATNHVRNQRSKQSARQATVISGLSTIYRNQTVTHAIQTHQQTEPRIFFLDITLDEMNKMYPKIHSIVEKGRLRPKGTEIFFVSKKMETYIITEDAVYEIHAAAAAAAAADTVLLKERIPVDGPTTIVELDGKIPLLVDESYYKLCGNTHATSASAAPAPAPAPAPFSTSYISPNHAVKRHMKIVVKTHTKSMTAFVFIMNDTETVVLDFYMTTENGVVANTPPAAAAATADNILTKTCKDDINSFLEHFKLCS